MSDLSDYVLKLHIITGPNGQCMCGVDGLTCLDRLCRLSQDLWAARYMANMGAERVPKEQMEKFRAEFHQNRLPGEVERK